MSGWSPQTRRMQAVATVSAVVVVAALGFAGTTPASSDSPARTAHQLGGRPYIQKAVQKDYQQRYGIDKYSAFVGQCDKISKKKMTCGVKFFKADDTVVCHNVATVKQTGEHDWVVLRASHPTCQSISRTIGSAKASRGALPGA